MSELVGNLLVAQSGGPTAVINASVAGVIQEAGRHECIEEIYGGLNGIWGILREELIDLNEEKAKAIEGLKSTPAAALGTCRYKLDFKKKPERSFYVTGATYRQRAVLAHHHSTDLCASA